MALSFLRLWLDKCCLCLFLVFDKSLCVRLESKSNLPDAALPYKKKKKIPAEIVCDTSAACVLFVVLRLSGFACHQTVGCLFKFYLGGAIHQYLRPGWAVWVLVWHTCVYSAEACKQLHHLCVRVSVCPDFRIIHSNFQPILMSDCSQWLSGKHVIKSRSALSLATVLKRKTVIKQDCILCLFAYLGGIQVT